MYTWVPFYEELATILARYRSRQAFLLEFLNAQRGAGLTVTPLADQDSEGRSIALDEIDPFTFFGTFNRRLTDANRFALLEVIKSAFQVTASLPSDFSGIPVLHPLNSWFLSYKREREADAVARLWDVFEAATTADPWADEDFARAFDAAIGVRQVGFKLTIGLFWIRPRVFLNLDTRMREFLQLDIHADRFSALDYRKLIADVRARDRRPFFEISRAAWVQAADAPPKNHWLVGAYWRTSDPPDRTEEFVRTGTWVNGYEEKFTDVVKQIQPGDLIAIKAATTQRDGLPFAYDKPCSKMIIKARGKVTRNRGDGRTLDVEWAPEFEPKDWYFYTYRATVWRVDPTSEFGNRLIGFVFHDQPQDYPFFIERWRENPPGGGEPLPEEEPGTVYTLTDALEGLFLEQTELAGIVGLLRSRTNVILQGPPGVGKSFVARRIAYALMGRRDSARIQAVQFHQSYSYEDFIQGFRPAATPGASLTFTLRNGIFYEFCERARKAEDLPHVFIIDEVNRGNLSKIFGELLMLIEPDKRGEAHAMRLTYQAAEDPPFSVPSNVYLLGLMNLADRSLAMVDYALRRRFAFVTLRPKFGSARFQQWLKARGVSESLVGGIVRRLEALNRDIAEDKQLGPHFEIGHSYFCPAEGSSAGYGFDWYRTVVEAQIGPLLSEYWYDDRERAEEQTRKLLAPF